MKTNEFYTCKNLNSHTYCGTKHYSLKAALNHVDRMPQKEHGWTVRKVTGEGTPFRYER